MVKIKVFILLLFISETNAYKFYQDHIPNGALVIDPCGSSGLWAGVGHKSRAGGGERNPFGLDFAANSQEWDETICRMDSDGDGKTNGEELGDPNCRWRHGAGSVPDRTTGISHPGICEPVDAPSCKIRNSWEVCKDNTFVCDAVNDPAVLKKELRFPLTKVPKQETTYICILVDVPTEGDFHIIGMEPIINNSNVMHHMLLFGCDESPELDNYVIPTKCFQKPNSCNELYGGWTVGNTGTCYNGPYGIRIGEKGKKKALLQHHWTNIELKDDYMDSSGLMIHYTPNLRVHDMGTMIVAQQELLIPPRQNKVEFTGMCEAECTEKLLSKPINVIKSNLHMHYLGHSGGVELFRNGRKVKNLVWQDTFDYDTPYYQTYEQPVQVNPGDSLQITCVFDSTSRSKTTTFGQGTLDEMCYGFLNYYPKQEVKLCGQLRDQNLCLRAMKQCEAVTFVQSEEAKNAFYQIKESCHPDRCLPGCPETLQQLQMVHSCFYPGPQLVKFLGEMFKQYKILQANQLFKMLVSCGLNPSKENVKSSKQTLTCGSSAHQAWSFFGSFSLVLLALLLNY